MLNSFKIKIHFFTPKFKKMFILDAGGHIKQYIQGVWRETNFD